LPSTVILTLKAAPAFASQGSYRQQGNNGLGNGLDPQPPGDPKINDGPEAFSNDAACWDGGPGSNGTSNGFSKGRRRAPAGTGDRLPRPSGVSPSAPIRHQPARVEPAGWHPAPDVGS
jgi:hypothetical protein